MDAGHDRRCSKQHPITPQSVIRLCVFPLGELASFILPFKSAKHDRGPRRAADGSLAEEQGSKPDSRRHDASEPEDHCERFDGQDGKLVRRGGVVARREREVGNGEEGGPDRDEDEEVDLRRRGRGPGAIEPGRDCEDISDSRGRSGGDRVP